MMEKWEEVLNELNNSKRKCVSTNEGLIVDDWIRVLKAPIESYCEDMEGLSLIAHDIVGGLFAVDISRFEPDKSDVWYFAPDTLEWESMGMQYESFIVWLSRGNLDGFYSSMRWQGWEKDCESVLVDQGILLYPFLWAKECDIETASKKVVPMTEIIGMNFDLAKKINSGSMEEVKITFE